LQEVQGPFSQTAHFLVELEDYLKGEQLEIILEQIKQENTNYREVIPRWRDEGAINLGGPLHEMPRKFDEGLAKFDPDKLGSPEDHLNNFFLDTHLLNVQHEDVVCMLFPYNFSGRASTFYFILLVGSISDLDDFERLFIRKFGERKMTASLHKELGAIKMDKKEKVKYFN